jgi:hypothetical protein
MERRKGGKKMEGLPDWTDEGFIALLDVLLAFGE